MHAHPDPITQMSDTPRPRPVRDTVQGPVTWQVAVTTLAMFILHGVLDRFADPAQYGAIWSAVQVLVEAGIVAGVGWASTHHAVRQAERYVTPIVDPAVLRVRDGRVQLIRLVPDPADPGRPVPIEPAVDVGFSDLSDPPPEPPHDRFGY